LFPEQAPGLPANAIQALPELQRCPGIKPTYQSPAAFPMKTPRMPVPMTLIATLAMPVVLLIGSASASLGAATTSSASHDLYNPARTALVNAQLHLAESSRQEQDILERLKRMHTELDSSLALLANAGDLDPSMRDQIEDARRRLAALQDKPALCPMDSGSSLLVYDQLLDDLQALIAHY
jgi:septal ring factor EnvC (AmiA/AmiB activator)